MSARRYAAALEEMGEHSRIPDPADPILHEPPAFVHRDNGTSRHRTCGRIIPTDQTPAHRCPHGAEVEARKETNR